MALRKASTAILPLAVAPPGTRHVTPQKQERDNWCWAACCSMAGEVAGLSPIRLQSSIAAAYLQNGMDCVADGTCDSPCLIEDVADKVFRLNGLHSAQIVSIAAQQPSALDVATYVAQSSVAVGLQGDGVQTSANHMVLIVYQAGPVYMVADPADGSSTSSSLADLLKNSSSGRTWAWTWTDLT
jgi:hypothetical protein